MQTSPISRKDAGTAWKLSLVLLVGIATSALVATMIVAAHRVAPIADANYYYNGLHYGRTASGAKNPGMGWRMSASLSADELRVQVKDENGAPIAGGRLSFEPNRHRADSTGAFVLSELDPGIFRAPRPASPQGELHGTLHFIKGEAAATRKLVIFN